MDAAYTHAKVGDSMRGGSGYEPPKLRLLGSLRALTSAEIPETGGGGGSELGPSVIEPSS
jgi:hypothetical protein